VTSAAMAVMGGLISRAKVHVRVGGRSHHRSHNNQPLTSTNDTVVAPQMIAMVWGLFWLYCDGKAITEATEISWLRCSSRAGLVVVLMVDGSQAFLCACVVLCVTMTLPESKSFDSGRLLPIPI
jgi:hypothetical protein